MPGGAAGHIGSVAPHERQTMCLTCTTLYLDKDLPQAPHGISRVSGYWQIEGPSQSAVCKLDTRKQTDGYFPKMGPD